MSAQKDKGSTQSTKKDQPKEKDTKKAAAPAAATLGKKWECFSCHVKFYDLGKPEPTCPRCGANQKNAPTKQAASKAAAVAAKKKRKPAKAEPDEAMDVLPVEDEVFLEEEFGGEFEATAEPEEEEEEY